MKCSACGSRDIDFHEAGGHSYCVACGNLVEENTIVNSIEFQENGDRSQVIGQFVAANCSRPYSSSRYIYINQSYVFNFTPFIILLICLQSCQRTIWQWKRL